MTGCAGNYALVRRDPVEPAEPDAPPIAWLSPASSHDEATLVRWRGAVGPPVLRIRAGGIAPAADAITLVSWNTALGAGDLVRLVRTLDRSRPLVLLLQEVYRAGPEVPRQLLRHASFARRRGGAAAGAHYREIESVASDLGLTLYYVPSMRNGAPSMSDEDRGNAILSDTPLTDFEAIELPFERQRRVAIAAAISGRSRSGSPWRVRLVCAHLDNIVTTRRAFVAGEFGRIRQARGLREAVQGTAPTVLGGDFNTWFGFSDQAYVETVRAFPDTRVSDRRATFARVLRLDHFFFRLPQGWRGEFRRADDPFGSDHFPLIGTLHVQ